MKNLIARGRPWPVFLLLASCVGAVAAAVTRTGAPEDGAKPPDKGELLVPTQPAGAPTTSPSAAPASGPVADPVARIRDEGLNRSQVMDTLSYLTDVIGPRLTGSPNARRANEW